MAIVQTVSSGYSGASTPQVTLAAPTPGNHLVAMISRRGPFNGTELTPHNFGDTTDYPLTQFGPHFHFENPASPQGMHATLHNDAIMAWREATGTEVQWTWDMTQMSVTVFEVEGGDWSSFVVQSSSGNIQETHGVLPSVGSAGQLAFAMFESDTRYPGYVTPVADAGWTVDDAHGSNVIGGATQEPYIQHLHGTGPIVPGSTFSPATEWGAMAVAITETFPECASPVMFDVYSLGDATTPALTYLATLCDAFDKSFRVELDGTGSGKFSINRSSADATAAILGDGDGDVRYIKVRIPDIDPEPIFGFFIEEGDFRLLDSDEQGGQTLTFSGHGSLAYLGFAMMLSHSYITGGMDPYTGLWRLYLAGTGNKPGQMLRRMIEEAQDADRPQVPLPLLTIDFDYTNDSASAAWASSDATAEFAVQINESILSGTGKLIGTGAITVQMSPDFLLSAYNSFGTDRSNATFAAGKVRFVGGTNIAEGLSRQVRPSRVATHVNVYGESEASVISSLADAATRVTREAGLSAFGSTATALEAIGDADLAERLLRSESLSVRIALGSDEAAGLYLPGPSGSTNGKFWVGDTVTLHTGTGEFDYNNASFPVAAINVIEGPNVALVTDLEVVVELGSTKIGDAPGGGSSNLLSASPGGGSSAVGPHAHPSTTVISAWKEPVRAASTANVTVASPGATIDGVTMALQDRVLLKDQSTGSQNGIYVWLGAAVPMSRAGDFGSGTMALGATVHVMEGTTNADTAWVCTTDAAITLGTTALTFEELAGGVTDHGALTGLADDDHPQYLRDPVDGDEVTNPLGSVSGALAVDPTDGNVASFTMTGDTTATIAQPAGSGGSGLIWWVTQDGTGGHDLTVAATGGTVTDDGTITPDTTAGVTVRYILERVPGTTNDWIRNIVGGSGGSALTVEDEGTPLATAATTLDFVGAGVTASGAGAEKTITIPGVTEAAVQAVGHYELLMVGSSPPEPLEDGTGTDWLYVWVN